MFPSKSSSYWGTPHDYGTPQVVLEAHAASAKTGSIDGAAMAQRGFCCFYSWGYIRKIENGDSRGYDGIES